MSPTLVVLAAGLSSRYGLLKQLEPVGPGGEALLDYGIFDALRAGFGRAVLVVRREIEASVRAHVVRRWDSVDIRYARQGSDPGRRKPWGTGHAVLAAADHVGGPFAVCNADDFYGAEAFVRLAGHLGGGPAPDHVLVGYPVAATLSAHGGVSRAVCEVDGAGFLRGLLELRDVRGWQGGVRGVDPDGVLRVVPDTALASMNLWGFTPDFLAPLHDGFAAFRDAHREDAGGEYLLSSAVDALVAGGRIRLRVLPAGDGWMGITHPGDRGPVVERLRRLVDQGRYPRGLAPPRGGPGDRI